MKQITDYNFLDFGNGKRLELFGSKLILRDFPLSEKVKNNNLAMNNNQKYSFSKIHNGWNLLQNKDEKWQIKIDNTLVCELFFAENGQIGIFPEHLEVWSRVKNFIISSSTEVKILNCFAYTGILTMIAAKTKNANITHLDASKSAINRAKKNFELSFLNKNDIRWIQDDCLAFLNKEVKRSNKYDLIILDPPAYGKFKNKNWIFKKGFKELFFNALKLLNKNNKAKLFLTAHEPLILEKGFTSFIYNILSDEDTSNLLIKEFNLNLQSQKDKTITLSKGIEVSYK